MNKVYSNATAALAGLLHDNMTIAAGGFGLCGIPENLIAALRDSGVKEVGEKFSLTTFDTLRGNGIFPALRCDHGSINPNSRVFVTASEYSTDPTNRFIGQAQIVISNVAPFNGGFLAWVNVAWGSPINVRFDVLVDP